MIAKGLAAGETRRHRRPAAPRAGRRRSRSSRAAGGPRREHLRALHPPSGRDDARHGARSCSSASMAYRQPAGLRPAERRLPDDPGRRRRCPAPRPETMAASVATPLERQFSTIAGLDSMTSSSTLGSTLDHAAVQPLARPRRRGAGRAGGDRGRRRGSCRPNMPTPPTYRKVNPADSADPLPRARPRRRCRSRRSTSTARR